ncbi:MAG: transketolase [Actinomycetota bacterium]|nr:transketolase [Actinomycetota bacterium]
MSTATTATQLDQLSINTIRTLSMDAVQKANSGHPGTPMALAPVAFLLYTRYLKHNPADPGWPDRDRFVLSAGHASMLLYSALHLSGYDLSMEEIKNFRQWGSLTPGHPERDRVHVTPGVETTTGPLGQGFANGVGMAMAERFLRERYGSEVMDHHVFSICSDGDMMEGIASEAASLAGHLGLGRLVYLYDDNHITIDGNTKLSFDTEDVEGRFRAYGWDTHAVEDANDLGALSAAIDAGIAEESKPTLIRVRSIIAWPAPHAQNTAAAHGAALGEDEVRATKEALGWDPDKKFFVPDGVYEHYRSGAERGERLQSEWKQRFDNWREADTDRAAEWDRAWEGRPMDGLADALPVFDPADKDALATRVASSKAIQAFKDFVPTMIGGAADLAGSTNTDFEDVESFSRDHAGRNVHYGVREHGMGGAINGLTLHGGIVRPFGSTFLQFSDYMRGSVRLSALMNLPDVWVYTHDSVGLGEDGPTHQPVEHYAALRAIPGLTVIRPGDPNETVEAWRVIIEDLEGPACLLLTRQALPVLDRNKYAPASGVAKGAYVLSEPEGDGEPEAVLIATGSEVSVALAAQDLLASDGTAVRVVSMPSWELFEAQELLAADGTAVRVVSMPSWELFDAQDDRYREEVLPPGKPTASIEAGVAQGWDRFAQELVSIERFGASAPGAEVMEKLGITPEAAADAVRRAIAAQAS